MRRYASLFYTLHLLRLAVLPLSPPPPLKIRYLKIWAYLLKRPLFFTAIKVRMPTLSQFETKPLAYPASCMMYITIHKQRLMQGPLIYCKKEDEKETKNLLFIFTLIKEKGNSSELGGNISAKCKVGKRSK